MILTRHPLRAGNRNGDFALDAFERQTAALAWKNSRRLPVLVALALSAYVCLDQPLRSFKPEGTLAVQQRWVLLSHGMGRFNRLDTRTVS
jgi:hypothetical protein